MKQIKVRVSSEILRAALYATDYPFTHRLPDFITLDGEVVVEEPTCCPLGRYGKCSVHGDWLVPTKEGECCDECADWEPEAPNGWCINKDCPCHKRECDCSIKPHFGPCHRPEVCGAKLTRGPGGALCTNPQPCKWHCPESGKGEHKHNWNFKAGEPVFCIDCGIDAPKEPAVPEPLFGGPFNLADVANKLHEILNYLKAKE